MGIIICPNCGKIIDKTPCQYCGEAKADTTVKLKPGKLAVKAPKINVVNASSEVTIEKGGEVYKYEFPSGTTSKEIVNASLASSDLGDVTPTYVQNQLTNNINILERHANESQADQITDEHSFKMNLWIFKYKFKRTITKS